MSDRLKFQKNLKRLFIVSIYVTIHGKTWAKSPQRRYCIIDGLQTRKCSLIQWWQLKNPSLIIISWNTKTIQQKVRGKWEGENKKWVEVGILTSKIRYEDNNETPRFSAIVSKKKKKNVRSEKRREQKPWCGEWVLKSIKGTKQCTLSSFYRSGCGL